MENVVLPTHRPPMFNPSREQSRRFLFETWRKYRSSEPLAGLETIAIGHILDHPEYHPVLSDPERYVERDYRPELSETNPFLHLMFHVALSEQLSIDQPIGVRAAYDALRVRFGDPHEAQHAALDCLVEMLWRAQRDGTPYDVDAYLDCMRRVRP